MLKDFLNDVRKWGERDTRIDSIILVGSYARGKEKIESDVDLVILTAQKENFVNNPCFANLFGNVKKSSTEFWGPCTSIRVFYEDIEVEFGFVEPSWMKMPLDAGTYRVLADGYKVIWDRNLNEQ